MKSLSLIIVFATLVASMSVGALPAPRWNKPDSQAVAVNAIAGFLSENEGRPLTSNELQDLSDNIAAVREAQANSVEVVRVQDGELEPQYVNDVYVCAGGKLAMGLFGFQMLNCANIETGRIVMLRFNSDWLPATGFVARGYVGLNIGVAANLGVMVHRRNPAHREGDKPFGSYKRSDQLAGGTINGSFAWWGALLGYYSKEDESVFLYSWQPGIGGEIGASDLQILPSRD